MSRRVFDAVARGKAQRVIDLLDELHRPAASAARKLAIAASKKQPEPYDPLRDYKNPPQRERDPVWEPNADEL